MEKRVFKPFLSHPQKGEFISPVMKIQTQVNYDRDIDSIIKELGLPIISIEVMMPFCLHLEDGIYPVKMNGKSYVLKYVKQQRDNILYIGGTGTNLEMVNDPKGYIRHSGCEVFFKGSHYNNQDLKDVDSELDKIINELDYSLALRANIEYLPLVTNKKIESLEQINISNWKLPQLKNHLTNCISKLEQYGKANLYSKLLIVIDLKKVISVLNRFVDVYRSVTKSHYLPNIKYTDIYNPIIHQFNVDGSYKTDILFMLPNPFMLALPDRTVEEHEKIWDILDKEKYTSISVDLLNSAHKNIYEENYSISIMDATTAFEIFIEQLLYNKLVKDGWKEEDIKKHLKKNNNWTITERVGSLFIENYGIDLQKDDYYSKWVNIKNIRDDIMHAGKRNVKESEAIKAVNVIENFMDNISRKIDNK